MSIKQLAKKIEKQIYNKLSTNDIITINYDCKNDIDDTLLLYFVSDENLLKDINYMMEHDKEKITNIVNHLIFKSTIIKVDYIEDFEKFEVSKILTS